MSEAEGDSLESALGNVSQLLRKRARDLDKREEEFKRMKKSFEEANPVAGNVSDVLRLNVGGTRIEVLRRTLTSVEGSMLASRFSGRWDASLEKDEDGNFFIDQPIELFLPMVNYLRAQASMTPFARPVTSPDFTKDHAKHEDFFRMLEYYGMTKGVYPVGIFEGNNRLSPDSGHPNYSIESEQWKTFKILPLRGNSITSIKSYEVKLGRSSSAKVGWAQGGFDMSIENAPEGVGYVDNSVSLDSGHSGLAFVINTSSSTSRSTNFLPLSGNPSLEEGTVIRTEDSGRNWYVNGTLVASSDGMQDGVVNLRAVRVFIGTCEPCLSVKGSVRISSIEFNY